MYAPVLVGQPNDNSGGMAIGGFVLGILSIPVAFIAICGVLFGSLGIIFSALGLRSLDRRSLAIAGLALAIIGVLLGVGNGVYGYFYTMNHYLYGPYAP